MSKLRADVVTAIGELADKDKQLKDKDTQLAKLRALLPL